MNRFPAVSLASAMLCCSGMAHALGGIPIESPYATVQVNCPNTVFAGEPYSVQVMIRNSGYPGNLQGNQLMYGIAGAPPTELVADTAYWGPARKGVVPWNLPQNAEAIRSLPLHAPTTDKVALNTDLYTQVGVVKQGGRVVGVGGCFSTFGARF
jgi:hypothetical protein